MSDTLRRWKGVYVLVLIAVAWGGSPLRAEPPRLSPAEKERVNQAIEAGYRYLLQKQKPTGTWAADKSHLIGYTALPGLTLLECGVPPEHESIQRAAAAVRQSAPT